MFGERKAWSVERPTPLRFWDHDVRVCEYVSLSEDARAEPVAGVPTRSPTKSFGVMTFGTFGRYSLSEYLFHCPVNWSLVAAHFRLTTYPQVDVN
jgi:hypothetical protein